MSATLHESTEGVDWAAYMSGFGLLAGPANVIMQLSYPAVGYGVLESNVSEGRFTEHPWKRSRTTVTYLAVALLGTDEDRATYSDAVTRVHERVRSGPDSSVKYSGLNPRLQLWVAACLYYGFWDITEWLRDPIAPEEQERIHREGARFGTTLQVRPEQWPATRADFAAYWREQLPKLRMDEPVRQYMEDVVRLRHLPWPIRMAAPISVFLTKGFLPPEFRALMHWDWSPRQERRFRRVLRVLRFIERRLPRAVRLQPFTMLLNDMRRRSVRERALV